MVALCLACGIAWAETVTVYDVGVEPDSLNKKVAVTYRLAETGAGVANVAMDIHRMRGKRGPFRPIPSIRAATSARAFRPTAACGG
jgi:hypothetical protein